MPRLTNGLSWISAALAFSGRLSAQQLEPRSVPSRGVESYSYQSATMERRYDVSVGLPTGYGSKAGKRYPALIVTDGNSTFPIGYAAAQSLAGDVEDLIVVSVGAPVEDGDTAFTQRRIHEFSPPNWAMTDKFGLEVTKACRDYRSKPGQCAGGAPKFLEFIVSELLPRLTAKYRIDPERLGLFGLSAGGFFASWVIFQPQSPFKTYIISSPAMAYGDGEIFRQEQQYAEGHKDLKVSIYIASGSLEIDDPFLEGIGQIVSGQAHFGAMLRSRKYPGLKLYSEIHHGLGHSDGAGTTLVRGIRLLYPK